MIRLYHQFDGYSHTWTLDGIKYWEGKELKSIGWKWASGLHCPGAFYTKDKAVAQRASEALNMPIEDITPRLKKLEYKPERAGQS